MRIDVNGELHEVTGTTVADVLEQSGWADARVATALNGIFVPKAERARTPVRDGDRLEVLAPMQGG